ncbi:glycosyltransferase [Providencia manganoxydans]|uniref:glycosyltransferase n=1 Tax=Providencia manganoxydans TaxID=2923283 RepID=UPI0034E45B72
MKSLILINSGESGGAEKVVSILSHTLTKDNTGIVFIKNNMFHEFNNNLNYFTLDENKNKKNKSILLLALKLKKIIKVNDIKIVQSHMYRSNYINILAKILGSKHEVQIVNCDCVSTKYTHGIKSILSKLMIRLLYRFSNITITKSKAMLEDLKKYTRIKNELVIYNPIDITKINKLSTVSSTSFNRNDYDFTKIIVSVGRFHPQKRQKDIIIALSHLDKSYGLVLIGDGEELLDCKNLAKELNISDQIIFTGNLKNPFSVISQCDLFIVSSSCEGFPNALVEAMACGLPIISSDHLTGAKEILSKQADLLNIKQYNDSFSCEEFGILYPVGNTFELTAAVNHIFSNNLIKYYSEKSKDRASNYDAPTAIAKYIDLLS